MQKIKKNERQKNPWQRPIFPRRHQRSIVGAETFHFRVRDGNGWFRLAYTTKGPSKKISWHNAHEISISLSVNLESVKTTIHHEISR